MSNTKRNVAGSVIALIISGAIIVASAWVFLHRQQVLDAITVWTYHPTSEVAAIEQRAGMTSKGQFVFYATRPEISDASTFNKECPRQEVGNPILGCYTTNDRIYIYDLTDAQLDGMKEVTATHEMLHAIWQRTSDTEKQHLTTLINAAYQKLDNPELKARMDYYQRTEPGEFINELHSILGTEIPNLGSELEAYYGQYFNRREVLALHDKYNSFYTGLSAQANDLYTKMQSLGASIDARSTTYNQDAAALSADITDFNNRANSGNFSSQSQFNSERAALVARSNQLEAERSAINADITTYNQYYSQYQQIAAQIQTLNNSMDSYQSLQKAPSV